MARMNDQEFTIAQMGQDLTHYKQELVEARARLSASDDHMSNVQGQLETLKNQVASLTDEGTVNFLYGTYFQAYLDCKLITFATPWIQLFGFIIS